MANDESIKLTKVATSNLHKPSTDGSTTDGSSSSSRSIPKSTAKKDAAAKSMSKERKQQGSKSVETSKVADEDHSQNISSISEVRSKKSARHSPNSELTNRMETSISSVSVTERKKFKMKKSEVRRYSSGIALRNTANVKRVSCDQLNPLATHKERFPTNKERRYWVIRKLYKIGGWVRHEESKKEKERIYIQPNSPTPSFLNATTAKGKKAKAYDDANQFDYLDSM